MCFHMLFPYGVGDVTRISGRYYATLTESNRHLLNYAVADNVDGNSYFYPFAMHNRWMHWVHNTAERRRIQGQKNIYMSHNCEPASISESDLRHMIDNNDPQLHVVIRNMQLYNSNITGLNSYFYKKNREN